MLLALDIGNSHIKIGGFYEDELVFFASIATDEKQTGQQLACSFQDIFRLYQADINQVSGVVLCCVVPNMTYIVQDALEILFDCPVLNVASGVKTGLNIKIDHPRILGSDLVAGAVWAMKQGHTPCVIVDMGTVVTFTAIDESGVLCGTAISAGIGIMQAAIKENAAQLPVVTLEEPPHGVLGRNTAEALKAGMVYGTAAMVDGMLRRYAGLFGRQPYIWLTGGSSKLVLPHLETPVTHDPCITLRGLQLIWQKNQG